MELRAKVESDSGKHSIYVHVPKDKKCDICLKTKLIRASCRRLAGTVVPRAENVGDLITADHKKISVEDVNLETIIDTLSWYKTWQQWTQSYPRKTITSQEIHKNLIKFLESTRNSNVIYTDNSLELRHWQLCRPVERPDSTHKHFACGCVDASLSHSHCPLAPADVAAFLTCMATIVQRVRGLGCWEPRSSRLSELPHRYAGRQVGAWRLTDLFKISPHRGHRWRSHPVARSPARSGHHFGVSSAWWWLGASELTGEGGRARLVGCVGGWSGRSVVRGNCTLPRSFGEGQGARVFPALAGSSHCSIRETLERFVSVQYGKVPHFVVVGAATSPQRRGGRSLRAWGAEGSQICLSACGASFSWRWLSVLFVCHDRCSQQCLSQKKKTRRSETQN